MIYRRFCAALVPLLLSACATDPAPVEQLRLTEQALAQAQALGLSAEQSAALRQAEEKFALAQAAMQDEDYKQARIHAEQAELDARLAEAQYLTEKSAQQLAELNNRIAQVLDQVKAVAKAGFARNIRMARIAREMSQEALAHEANLDRAFVGTLERGTRNISIDTAVLNNIGVSGGEQRNLNGSFYSRNRSHYSGFMQKKNAFNQSGVPGMETLDQFLAAGGYPDAYAKGKVISGLDGADSSTAKVFHAGTELKDTHVVTNGGRVLCATALGANVTAAQQAAYQLADKISWDGMFCRTDIGYRAIAREQK